MNSTPKISIGMPVYNGEKFIRSAIDTLLAQSFTDFELIVSDNASTDMTDIICRTYEKKDSRIKYVRQAKNIGSFENFQYVLDKATAEYFMWAAADDEWDNDWIEQLLPIAEYYQCIATGVFKPIDTSGNEIKHPANGRILQYYGSSLFRRMKFYLEPGVLGKGNPIYGIMPATLLKKVGVSWVASEPVGGATVYLYVLLENMSIRCKSNVKLHKRLHSESYGEMITPIKISKSAWGRYLRNLLDIFLQPRPSQYIKKSSFFEKPLIWLLYPFAVAWIFFSAITWKFTK